MSIALTKAKVYIMQKKKASAMTIIILEFTKLSLGWHITKNNEKSLIVFISKQLGL